MSDAVNKNILSASLNEYISFLPMFVLFCFIYLFVVVSLFVVVFVWFMFVVFL